MPVFPDLEENVTVNPFLVDLLVVSDNRVIPPTSAEKVTFKLKPIFVSFPIFERLFFKKRGSTYRRVKLTFLNALLCKLKPKLVRFLHRYALHERYSGAIKKLPVRVLKFKRPK